MQCLSDAVQKRNLIETKMFLSNAERPANIITHTQLYPEARQYLRLSSWPDWSNLLFLFVFLLKCYTKETSTSFKIWSGRDECVWWFSGGRRSSSDQSRSHSHTTFHDVIESSGQFNVSRDFTWLSLIWFLLVHVTYWFIFPYPWLKRLSWLNLTENFGDILPCFLVTKWRLIPFMS